MPSRRNGRKRAVWALLLSVLFGFENSGFATVAASVAAQSKGSAPAVNFVVSYAQLQKELSIGFPARQNPSLFDAAVISQLSAPNQAKMGILLQYVGFEGLNASAPTSQGRDIVGPSSLAQKTVATLDGMLDKVSEKSLQDPKECEALLAALWDGALWKLYGAQTDAAVASVAGHVANGLKLADISQLVPARQDLAESVPRPAMAVPAKDSRRAWEANRGAILAQAQILRERVEALAQRRWHELGADDFQDAVEKGKIFLDDSILGRGEINSLQVDGKRVWFVRVVHAPTQLSIFFLDQNIPRDIDGVHNGFASSHLSIIRLLVKIHDVLCGSHLRQIMARQVIDAGANRKDGEKGRNVVIAWERNGFTPWQRGGRVTVTDFREKPVYHSRAWWKAYWYATWKMPIFRDLAFGVSLGLLQGVLMYKVISYGGGTSLIPVMYTTFFGALIGTLISTYKNWTYRGTALSQYVKIFSISLLFAFPVEISMFISAHGLSAMLHLAVLWAMTSHVFFNGWINNLGKAVWAQIPRMVDSHRQFRKLPWGIKIKVGDYIYQFFYMVNWTLRSLHLVHVPHAMAIFIAGMGIGALLAYLYAKSFNFPDADEMLQAPGRWLQKIRSLLARS